MTYASRFNPDRADTYPSLLEPLAGAQAEQAARANLIDWYWQAHPRFQFFKALPQDAKLLDLGAGSGGLAFWKEYQTPLRPDIAMYAVDMREGEHFGRYAGFQVANLDVEPLAFEDGFFDAVLASHVLEHVQSADGLLRQLHARLRGGGRLYLEIPAEHTKRLPKRDAFVAMGWPMMIANFFDDGTHLDTWTLPALLDLGTSAGFTTRASGFVVNPFLDEAMIRHGVQHQDSEVLLYGFWAKTHWAQYAIFEKT